MKYSLCIVNEEKIFQNHKCDHHNQLKQVQFQNASDLVIDGYYLSEYYYQFSA